MSSKSRRQRRTFTEEFKRDAVNLVVIEGYTVSAAAKAGLLLRQRGDGAILLVLKTRMDQVRGV